jgi:hypothetical protein
MRAMTSILGTPTLFFYLIERKGGEKLNER